MIGRQTQRHAHLNHTAGLSESEQVQVFVVELVTAEGEVLLDQVDGVGVEVDVLDLAVSVGLVLVAVCDEASEERVVGDTVGEPEDALVGQGTVSLSVVTELKDDSVGKAMSGAGVKSEALSTSEVGLLRTRAEEATEDGVLAFGVLDRHPDELRVGLFDREGEDAHHVG